MKKTKWTQHNENSSVFSHPALVKSDNNSSLIPSRLYLKLWSTFFVYLRTNTLPWKTQNKNSDIQITFPSTFDLMMNLSLELFHMQVLYLRSNLVCWIELCDREIDSNVEFEVAISDVNKYFVVGAMRMTIIINSSKQIACLWFIYWRRYPSNVTRRVYLNICNKNKRRSIVSIIFLYKRAVINLTYNVKMY